MRQGELKDPRGTSSTNRRHDEVELLDADDGGEESVLGLERWEELLKSAILS